jgi:hypothetical protein
MSEEKSHDPIIERVVDKIRGRSKVGLKKYGVSLMDDPGKLDDWLNHLQEELMDAVNYIERAREELKVPIGHLGFDYYNGTGGRDGMKTCDCTRPHNDCCRENEKI